MLESGIGKVRGLLKRYGPSTLKMKLWDQEFASDHWDFIDDTASDCVYPVLARYTKGGNVLDLGCGPGNTANEMAESSYASYVGVDISDVALEKARKRTERDGRTAKNSFVCSDFLSFQTAQTFDVILFRESMYHVPLNKVRPILTHFSNQLKPGGVFVVRMNTSDRKGGQNTRLTNIFEIIESEYTMVEKNQFGAEGPTVAVFQPRRVRG